MLKLQREDLNKRGRQKPIEDVNMYDIKGSLDEFKKANIVLFIDDNDRTKILKNRWGYMGMVNTVEIE